MSRAEHEWASPDERSRHSIYWLGGLGVAALFLLLRLATMHTAAVLEDHDSVAYLSHIGARAGQFPSALVGPSPDITPMYPLIGAAVARLGLETETAGRTASLLLAGVGVAAAVGIAWRYYGPRIALVAGLIMAASSQYVWLDVSVLTEPTYAGLLYLGLFLYIRKYGDSSPLWYALPLGAVFGTVFLTRTEGIMFVVLVPLLHLVATAHRGQLRKTWRQAAAWSLIFVLGFSVLAAPQIISVSRQMGTFAINGREAWMTILQAPGEAGYEARLRGLDYSPQIVNLYYLRAHPQALAELESTRSILSVPRTILENATGSLWKRALQIAGPALPFVCLGLFVIFRRPRTQRIWVIVGFCLVAAIPAFMHTLAFRHIAFLGPIFSIVAAVGLVDACLRLAALGHWPVLRQVSPRGAMAAGLALILLGHMTIAAERIAFPPEAIWDYAPRDIAPVVAILQDEMPSDRPAVVMSRKGFVPYYTRSKGVMTPWTDYEAMVRYAELNGVEYLFTQRNTDGNYPWAPRVAAGAPEFELIYKGGSARGSEVALYRYIPRVTAQAHQAE